MVHLLRCNTNKNCNAKISVDKTFFSNPNIQPCYCMLSSMLQQIILSVVVKLVTLSPFYGQTLSFQSMGLFPSAASSSYYCQCHILCCRKSYPVLHRVLHPSIDLTTIVDKLFTYFYTWTNILFAATSM